MRSAIAVLTDEFDALDEAGRAKNARIAANLISALRPHLRRLVDVTWSASVGDHPISSTEWADRLIEKALAADPLELRLCDCTCLDKCPNGRAGTAARCSILVRPA